MTLVQGPSCLSLLVDLGAENMGSSGAEGGFDFIAASAVKEKDLALSEASTQVVRGQKRGGQVCLL